MNVLVKQGPSTFEIGRTVSILSQKHFTGVLRVQDQSRLEWKLGFHSGWLIWAAGGPLPRSRWGRHLYHAHPELGLEAGGQISTGFVQAASLRQVLFLYQQDRLTQEQLVEMVEGILAEVLFDLIQAQEQGHLWYGRQPWEDRVLPQTRILLQLLSSGPLPHRLPQPQQLIQQSSQHWSTWKQAALTALSPNLAPVIKDQQQFQAQVQPSVYRKLKPLLTGRLTLRSVALLLNQDQVALTRALLSHPVQDQIAFTVPTGEDLEHLVAIARVRQSPSAPEPTPARGPLIACIDDSQQIVQMLGYISAQAGYRFLPIQDPIKGVAELIRQKPDLVFLDLQMPMTSGYEICGQIHKISRLKQTPVIILTQHDGVIDRVRAKLVGATDFVSKPIETDKILGVIEKHLGQNSSEGKG